VTVALVTPLGHPGLLAAAAAAAVLHAVWNVMAKSMKDQVSAFWLINVTAMVCGALALAAVGWPKGGAWVFLAVSMVVHVGYNTTLLNSYRYGDIGQVYPLARGVAPLLVAVGAYAFVSESLAGWQMAGVLVVAAGLTSLVWSRRAGLVGDRRAVLLALATGLTIATYSVIDGVGVRHAGNPLAYAGVLFLGEGAAVAGILMVRRRSWLPARPEPAWVAGVAGGALSVLAYVLVLWAQTRADLAVVSALRETSVVVAALLGAFVLGEGGRRRRVAAAMVVVAGTALLVLG
jgi:drug/metabolite transporter (DMT)-like permease